MKNKTKIIGFLTLTFFLTFFSFISVFATEGLQLNSESKLSVKIQNDVKYVIGLSEEKKVSDLLLNFTDYSEMKAYKNNVSLGENEIVSTGTLINCGNDEAYVIIKGDADGDGYVDSTDYLQIKGYFLGNHQLDEIHFLAADAQTDGQIDSTDYLQIKGYFLGKYNLYPTGKCEHSFGEWVVTKNPNCIEKGVKIKTCQKCSAEEAVEILPLGHVEVIDEFVAPTQTTTGLTEGKHCSVCKTVIKEQEIIPALSSENVLWSETLDVDGKNISGVVSNSTDVFSFINDIHVENKLIWALSTDVYGMNNIATKTAPLCEGENIFYIHITHADQSVSTYTVSIYRKYMYTVSFDTSGGTSVEKQYVEEGCYACKPITLRDGYTFDGWNYDFSKPITANTTITASWIANANTPYKVEYYLQNVEKTEYELLSCETENLVGITDITVTAEEKSFEHFTLDRSLSELSGNVNGKGTLVLKVYYTRNTYSVSAYNATSCSITNGGTYAYGTQITVTANVTKLGYRFIGWYSGDELLSTAEEYSFIVDKNVFAKTEVVDELKNFNFTSTETACIITGLKDKSVTFVVIPDFVTSIRYSAFENCTSLESATIPDSVTSIGISAFEGCTNLTKITLPFVGATKSGTSNTHLGYIFGTSSYYSNKTYVPESLKTVIITGGSTIDSYAFYNCISLESVIAYDGVTSIGDDAFTGCKSLKNVTIPDSVTSIGSYAFYNCTSLGRITIPNNVTFIGSSAFEGCTSLTYNEYNNSYYLGNLTNPYMVLIKAKSTDIASCVIHNDTKLIYSSAFNRCQNLVSITIPDGVTSIGSYAFRECTSLYSVTIPDSVTSIGVYAFDYCTSLESITIPRGVTSIGSYLFKNCINLESITIPDSVTSIGDKAFLSCENLESVKIPHSVTSIGEGAFGGCKSLTQITIPDSVTSIGKYSFNNCPSLESVIISDSVTSIGDYAFANCISLTHITYGGTKSQWNKISKGADYLINTGVYTIYCTDGNIT